MSEVMAAIWAGLGGAAGEPTRVRFEGTGEAPSVFAVSDLLAASVGAACLAAAELIGSRHGEAPCVTVDRRLSLFWCGNPVEPQGWALPPSWDAVAGDYRAADGWIKLHTNAPHHRAAALEVLGAPADRGEVAQAVLRWPAEQLQDEIVVQGGCAAAMRNQVEWAAHPQGGAVAAEPLMHYGSFKAPAPRWTVPHDRPLAGVRVLDLTRVLAGPVATRFLAGFGADVLRIDPPDWDEPALLPGVTLGKRYARLDLRKAADLDTLRNLLRGADVVVHGYRPGALERLGFGAAARQALRPGLVDVSLDAYGWSGPWQGRRGFDSLVQMSSGIAEAGMRLMERDEPAPLPVQALDHATGYLLAAAAVRGLTGVLQGGEGSAARTSLARVAALLTSLPTPPRLPFTPKGEGDFAPAIEETSWGPLRRLRPPAVVDGAPMRWDLPAMALGTSAAEWRT